MKIYAVLLFLLAGMLGNLMAEVYHSTTMGGWWMDPNTWQSTGYPDADDDVYIHGIVFVIGENSCNHLDIQGSDAMIKCGDNASGTLTVNGNLTTSGWVTSSASYNLTLNLYGNLSINYNFVPHNFNWLGTGVKTLSCGSSSFGLRTRNITSISASIEAIQAISDIYFLPGGTYTPVIKGNGGHVDVRLFDPDTRTTYNLNSRSCRLEYLKIQGDGSSEFNFNNDSNLGNVWMSYCELENLLTSGTQMFDNGCSVTDITNNGSIYNAASGSRDLYVYGPFTNNGQVGQAPHGYNFNVYSYGDISNTGLFRPSNLYLRGTDARTLFSTAANPIQASISMTGEAELGNVYAGDQLHFANINNVTGPLNFKAFSQSNQARTLTFNNVKIYSAVIEGITGSSLNGTDLLLQNTPISNLDLQGSLFFNAPASLTNVVNHGTLQNYNSSGSVTIAVYGDFANYGSVANYGGMYFTVNAWDDVRSYGTWTAYRLNLYGDDAQEICFGAAHPFAGSYCYDMDPTSSIYVVEEDLYINCPYMDLNYSTLYLNPGGFDLHLSGTELIEANIVSELGNILNMSNNARLNNVGFQSVTNAGTMNMTTTTSFSGSLINNGTVQDWGASVSLSVAGDITNNGSICNSGGYFLTLNGGGNLINNGSWTNYSTRLNSPNPQIIHFPEEHPYRGSYFYDLNGDSSIQSDADLWFVNTTTIDSNYSIWRLDLGNWDLHLDNCIMVETYIHATEASVITMVNGGHLTSCTFQSITVEGTLNLNSNTPFSGNLINNGMIQNHGNSITLSVMGNCVNNGTIRSNEGYHLYVHLGGDAINNGNWGGYSLTLNGSTTQLIHFPSGHGFTGSLFNDNNSASSVVADSDQYITNATIDLNSSPLQLTGGHDLWLDNCILVDVPVLSGQSSQLSMVNGGYISNCSFQGITMNGTISLNSETSVSETLVNLGILQSHTSSVSLIISGGLDNQGTIRNNPGGYHLYLYCGQNIVNSGVISTHHLYLTGASPQSISSNGSIGCSNVTDHNAISSVTLLTDLQLSANVDFNGATLILNDGSRIGKTLTLSGGYFIEATVVGGNTSRLVTGNGNWMSSLAFDDIIWEGVVTLNSSVSVNTLVNRATVQCTGNSSATLAVNGRLDNMAEGVFQNNNYNLTLNCYGDIYNHGQLRNYDIYFRSGENQSIWQSASADTIRCGHLRKTNTTGTVTMLSNLFLKNCHITFNCQDLIMESGRTVFSLSLYGSYLESIDLVSSGYATLNLAGGAYIGSSVTGANMIWTGYLPLISNTTINNLINQGVIQNQSGYYGYLYVNGRLDNYGTISNASSYPLDVYSYGDVYDYGNIGTRYFYFNGTDTQAIFQSPEADVISSAAFRKTVGSGDVMMLSDLRLQNCSINLNSRSLFMNGGGMDHTLYMSGAHIENTYLASPGNATLDFSLVTRLNNINGGNLTLRGTVYIYGTCNFGSIINHGVTRNLNNEYAHLYVNGDLVNHGTFHCDDYPLYIYVTGHVTNNGTMAHRRVHITGTADQNVQLNGSETIDALRLQSNIGSAVWYRDGSPSGLTGSYIDLAMNNPLLMGVWQAYVASTNTWDRIITVSPVGTLNAPENLSISLSGDDLLLRWNQVNSASSYTIFTCETPDGVFSVLMSGITDPNPGDGIVEQTLPPSSQRRFYRVTGSN
ncbi:MAG TPA: hypothetical protein PKX36_04930 [Candidatus Cloacimonadota bacterium]|nr:hypothetical protein [Candidatus Cloacimonadota bacterium]